MMPKEQWVNEVYKLLCQSQGAPVNETEKRNLLGWAETLADGDDSYYAEGMTPLEAHNEELSYA